MLIIYEDIGLILNLGSPSPWCFVEKKDQQNEETKEMSYGIIFVFAGGLGRPVGFPTKELRDQQFDEIKVDLFQEGQRQPRSQIVPVGVRPPGGLIAVERR